MNKETPIFALTGNVGKEYEDEAKKAGMQGLLAKPIDYDILAVTIQESLGGVNTITPTDSFNTHQKSVATSHERHDDHAVSDVVIPEINSVFDPKMLNDLQSVIGESQFEELLNSLITSTDEILGRLHIAIVQQNSIDIKNRAHELKGKAANFGLTELSSLSAAIEDYARKNDINAISKIGETLESAKDRAQKALEDWKS